MRLAKLSSDEFIDDGALESFFIHDLPTRHPPGLFCLAGNQIKHDGLFPGETVLFSYRGRLRCVARALTGRQDNIYEDQDEYPYCFLVDLGSLRRADVLLSDLERQLGNAGATESLAGQGWTRITDDERAEKVIANLSERASVVPDLVDIHAIAAELNTRAAAHPIGQLQEIRKKLKGLARRPGQHIFSAQTVFDDYAFHHGGRSELQFNIGTDGSGGAALRHGIAFSFETNQTLPNIDVLMPKVRLFSEFLQLYPDLYANMRMWYWEDGQRSTECMPGPIPPEIVKQGVFFFLGKLRRSSELDYELILDDFDRLLPLYRYVESGGEEQPVSMATDAMFAFHPGCTVKAQATVANHAITQLDVILRHNVLQKALYDQLVSEFGEKNVGTELASGAGTSVDVVVHRPDGYWFYEIKTAHSPRACIREAIGQLLEYAFWPRAQEACRLFVPGESVLDKDGKEYLQRLRKRFSLPIDYLQVVV